MHHQKLSVNALTITDKNGVPRCELRCDDEPRFSMLDRDGFERLVISLNSDGIPLLNAFASDTQPTFGLRLANDEAGIRIYDKQGYPKVELRLENGYLLLATFSVKGKSAKGTEVQREVLFQHPIDSH